jgi:hypothetical protein
MLTNWKVWKEGQVYETSRNYANCIYVMCEKYDYYCVN